MTKRRLLPPVFEQKLLSALFLIECAVSDLEKSKIDPSDFWWHQEMKDLIKGKKHD